MTDPITTRAELDALPFRSTVTLHDEDWRKRHDGSWLCDDGDILTAGGLVRYAERCGAALVLAPSVAPGGVVAGLDYTDIANRAQSATGRSIWPSTAEAVIAAALSYPTARCSWADCPHGERCVHAKESDDRKETTRQAAWHAETDLAVELRGQALYRFDDSRPDLILALREAFRAGAEFAAEFDRAVGSVVATRTITSAAELDALPVGSVIGFTIDGHPRAMIQVAPGEWECTSGTWWASDRLASHPPAPLTILHDSSRPAPAARASEEQVRQIADALWADMIGASRSAVRDVVRDLFVAAGIDVAS